MTRQATDNQHENNNSKSKASCFFWENIYHRRDIFKFSKRTTLRKLYVFKSKLSRIWMMPTEDEFNQSPLWNSEYLIHMIINNNYSYCKALEACGIGEDLYINKNNNSNYNVKLNLQSISGDNIKLEDIEYAISISEFRLQLAKAYLNHIKTNSDRTALENDLNNIIINRYKNIEGHVVADEIPRALGLWMWDQINLWKTCKTYNEAINKLYDLTIDNKHVITEINYTNISNTTLERYIRITKKCIDDRKIHIFTDNSSK